MTTVNTLNLAVESLETDPVPANAVNNALMFIKVAINELKAQAVSSECQISIQEAWEAAGGNPGIQATRDELLTALRQLDAVCDESDATTTEVQACRSQTAEYESQSGLPVTSDPQTEAQAVQEPVAWMIQSSDGHCMGFIPTPEKGTVPVYATPPNHAAVMRQALEALERGPWTEGTRIKYNDAIAALRAVLGDKP